MENKHGNLAMVGWLVREALPYWPHVLGLLTLSILTIPLSLMTPVPLKVAIDYVIGSDRLPGILETLLPSALQESKGGLLLFAASLVVIVAVFTQVTYLGSSLLRTRTSEKLVLGFRARLFTHVQQLSLAYHDSRGTADSTYRILWDTASIKKFVVDGVVPFLTAVGTLFAMIVVIVRLSWPLAVICLLIPPAIYMVSRPFNHRLRTAWENVKEIEGSTMSALQEVLTGLRVVKAFGSEEREKDRLVRLSKAGMDSNYRAAVVGGAFGVAVGVTISTAGAAMLFIGVRQVQSGALTVGDLLVVMWYLTQIYSPLQTLGSMVTQMQSALVSTGRALTVLEQQQDIVEDPHPMPLERCKGAIEFRDVSFTYENGATALSNVSFHIGPSTRLGIAGATGAGKTTLVSLLTRFYDPSGGEILLDGLDLRRYRLADLRGQFAIVLQEPILFSTSIAENISYGRPSAASHEIEEAARLANAHDFILNLPEGYHTQVGERGMKLSGGERQRISLARAFLKNAPILILDEPTSSVDVKTEGQIMDATERLMSGRTTFIIAHRLSTLRQCSRVLVLDRGRLAALTEPDAEAVAEAILAGDKLAKKAGQRTL